MLPVSDNDASSLAVAGRPGPPRRQPRYEQTAHAGQVSTSGRWRPPTTVTTPPRSSTTGALSHAVAGGLQALVGLDQEGNGGWAPPRVGGFGAIPTRGEVCHAAGRGAHRPGLRRGMWRRWTAR